MEEEKGILHFMFPPNSCQDRQPLRRQSLWHSYGLFHFTDSKEYKLVHYFMNTVNVSIYGVFFVLSLVSFFILFFPSNS